MADRRRVNGPPGGTLELVFPSPDHGCSLPQRARTLNQLRKIYLETDVVSSAAGSAYLELEAAQTSVQSLLTKQSSPKLLCTIHGPKPLPRNVAFSPNLHLSVSVKFAPFATRQRGGYIRDASERDISAQVEAALAGVIIPDRLPKSAVEVVITVLEAEDDNVDVFGDAGSSEIQGIGHQNIVSGCITAASAALLEARIDCLDLLVGGVAATTFNSKGAAVRTLDPTPFNNDKLSAVCVVAYMPTRDEVTLVWTKGDTPIHHTERVRTFDSIIDGAINAAKGYYVVLRQVVTNPAQPGA